MVLISMNAQYTTFIEKKYFPLKNENLAVFGEFLADFWRIVSRMRG